MCGPTDAGGAPTATAAGPPPRPTPRLVRGRGSCDGADLEGRRKRTDDGAASPTSSASSPSAGTSTEALSGERGEENPSLRDLRSLLSALGKERHLPSLRAAGIASVEDLATTPVERFGAPRMIARSLSRISSESSELYALLKSRGKSEYYAALVAGADGKAGIRTLEDLVDASIERLSPPLPKMTARMLKRRAAESIELRPLRSFLAEASASGDWTRHLNDLAMAGYMRPIDIRDASAEELAEVVSSQMVARILMHKALRAFPRPLPEPPMVDGPKYDVELSMEAAFAVKEMWVLLWGGSQSSFGTRFCEILSSLDHDVRQRLADVDLEAMGADIDVLVDRLVEGLDDPEEFRGARDELVRQLLGHGLDPRSIWTGDAAFSLAATSVVPKFDFKTGLLDAWGEFYRAVVPPLHPSLLRAAGLPSKEDWTAIRGAKLSEGFARRGYLYIAVWTMSDEHPRFFDDLESTSTKLALWQSGTGSWTDFENACQGLFVGMKEEMALEFCILAPKVAEDAGCSPDVTRRLGNALEAVAIRTYGAGALLRSHRAVQRELVEEQWGKIYRHAAEAFGEGFYGRFTRDPAVRETFQGTNMMMQRKVFVHQLNSTLLRINEDVATVLRPVLVQLGARHRVYYRVGRREMLLANDSVLPTVKEMLGLANWTDDAADAWAYVLAVVENYMLVGWTCGAEVLEAGQQEPTGPFDSRALKTFRDGSPQDFERFFDLFAKAMDAGAHSNDDVDNDHVKRAPSRYHNAVNCFLDEPDSPQVTVQIQALGRHHRNDHENPEEVLMAAGPKWMALAKNAFGIRFTEKVALDWARLWSIFAEGMSPKLRRSSLSFKDLTAPYASAAATDAVLRASIKAPKRQEKIMLALKEKTEHPQDTCLLSFRSSQPVNFRAGHFVKLRFTLPDGTTPSRFYSVASCPCPIKGTTSDLQFLLKEVRGGRVSPYLVREMRPGASCELLNVAGSFVLPQPLNGTFRLMVSAGVGIVAFMSALRSVVAQVECGVVTKKVHLALIHSERHMAFPFLNELLSIARKFANHPLFSFDLTLCFTMKQTDLCALEKLQENQNVTVKSQRVDRVILSEAMKRFDTPADLPVFGCGPRTFQKMVRETILKQLGHRRTLMHLEYFDL